MLLVGYIRWISPRTTLSASARLALSVILLTLVGGLLGGVFWWVDEPGSFSWDLPPLVGRMLAAAAWAFALVCFMALENPTRSSTRLVLWMLFIYLAPIAVAAVAFHLDRFNPAAFITYGFFGTVVLLTTASTFFLLAPPHDITDKDSTSPAADPIKPLVKLWLTFVATITGLWGVCLFVTDIGATKLIWTWPGDLLSSRLIAVMLFTICGGALLSLKSKAEARMMLAVTAVYGAGVTIAGLWNVTVGKPLPIAYIAVFSLLCGGSLLAMGSLSKAPG